MKFPYFLGLILIFFGWFSIKRHQALKKEKENRAAFFQKEEDANATRRQDISDLPYVKIPTQDLPFGIVSTPDIQAQESLLKELAEKPILNLTGISNTDLKLLYGAANLPFLTECDENFTSLCQAVHKWGFLLYEENQPQAAEQVLKFGIDSGSDISGSYLLLAKIYEEQGNTSLISNLILRAEKLNSLSKDTIILKLSEFVHK